MLVAVVNGVKMSRGLVLGLMTLAAAVALALLTTTRAQAAAPEPCASTDGFVPAFCVAVPTAERRATTVPLVSLPAARADVRVQSTVPGVDAVAIAALTDRAVVDVETRFGRGVSARPRILVFSDAASFAQGVREVFGYSDETAQTVAEQYGGIFDRGTLTIALNWSSGGLSRMAPAIAHELTHQMVREATGARALPAWFDEGMATLVEQEQPAATWSDDDRVVGRALAATGAVSLARLETLADWHAAYPRFGRALYGYAAEAVRAMRERLGDTGFAPLLDAVRGGEPLDAAYARLSGDTLAALDARLGAAGTGISVRTDGTGVVWTLAIGRPGDAVEVAIDGTDGYHLTFVVTTDGLGLYRAAFGATAAPGTYTVRAAGAAATFVTTRGSAAQP